MKKNISILMIIFLFLITGNAMANSEDDLSYDQIAYYPFNGNANDESGNGNHAQVKGAVLAPDRSGKADNAYLFDGKDDFLLINASAVSNFSNLSQASFCAWVKTTDDNGTIIQQVGNNQTIYKLALKDGFPYFLYKTVSDNWEEVVSTIKVNNGKWHHIAAVMTGSHLKIFLDGEFHNSIIQKSFISGNGAITIGNMITGFSWYEGSIDEVRIYKRELSHIDVKKIYLGAYPVFPTRSEDVLLDKGVMPLLWDDTSQFLDNQRYMVSISDDSGILIKELVVNDNILVIPPDILKAKLNDNPKKQFNWEVQLIADTSESVTSSVSYTTLTSGSFEIMTEPSKARSSPPGYIFGKLPVPRRHGRYLHLTGGRYENKKFRTYYGYFILILQSDNDYTIKCSYKNKTYSITVHVNPFRITRAFNFKIN